jgi:hypothetical protein
VLKVSLLNTINQTKLVDDFFYIMFIPQKDTTKTKQNRLKRHVKDRKKRANILQAKYYIEMAKPKNFNYEIFWQQ